MKKILITGGCGFVGRHLVKRLSKNPENEITIVDNLSTGYQITKWPEHLSIINNRNINIFYVDCIDFFNESDKHFDVIFHLAAIVEGRLTIDNNPLKVAKDLAIDSAMFEWSVKTRPDKIVYFSSSAVYPIKYQTTEKALALSEDLIDINKEKIDVPDMTYGWSKLTGEFLSNIAVKKHGLKVAVYRPFSGYGEDQTDSYPFPAIMKRIIAKENPIDVWGDGTQSRDFIYIEDCIDGILQTYEKINDGSSMNLGRGIKVSFLELIEEACNIEEHAAIINKLLDKPIGVHTRFANITKQLEYGFSPKTSLSEGIKTVIKYLKNETSK